MDLEVVSGTGHAGRVTKDDILAYIAENRVLRDFTCVERKQLRILPLCDADGLVPDSGI